MSAVRLSRFPSSFLLSPHIRRRHRNLTQGFTYPLPSSFHSAKGHRHDLKQFDPLRPMTKGYKLFAHQCLLLSKAFRFFFPYQISVLLCTRPVSPFRLPVRQGALARLTSCLLQICTHFFSLPPFEQSGQQLHRATRTGNALYQRPKERDRNMGATGKASSAICLGFPCCISQSDHDDSAYVQLRPTPSCMIASVPGLRKNGWTESRVPQVGRR